MEQKSAREIQQALALPLSLIHIYVQIGAGGRFHLEDRPRHSRGERARVQL